jgi:hypothetical protein
METHKELAELTRSNVPGGRCSGPSPALISGSFYLHVPLRLLKCPKQRPQQSARHLCGVGMVVFCHFSDDFALLCDARLSLSNMPLSFSQGCFRRAHT